MKSIKRIAVVVIALGIIGFLIYLKYEPPVKLNDNYVNGNTAGNLYNAGLFCESDGLVYFANPNDCNYLYSMSPSGEDMKKLCEDSVMYINADSNYVYYVRNNNPSDNDYSFFSYNKNSLCRFSKKKGEVTILDEAPCIYASLIGNYIYYLHYDTEDATTLYKIKINGKEKKQVSNKYLFNCGMLGQYFYYNSTENGMLYKYDTANDSKSLLLEVNCYKPTPATSEDVYYLDVNQNNALVYNNISTNSPIVLDSNFIELYNVYGNTVFYQRGGENPALCMIKNDGTGYTEIMAGEFTNINVTSFYIYFSDYRTGQMYYANTLNPTSIYRFDPPVD